VPQLYQLLEGLSSLPLLISQHRQTVPNIAVVVHLPQGGRGREREGGREREKPNTGDTRERGLRSGGGREEGGQSIKPMSEEATNPHCPPPPTPSPSPRQSTLKFVALFCLEQFAVRDTSQLPCPQPPISAQSPPPSQQLLQSFPPSLPLVSGVPLTLTLTPGVGLGCGANVEEGGEGWAGLVSIMSAVI
jgi:hypothetical protein